MLSGPMTIAPFRSRHPELHSVGRAGWLRALVMGANDGIVSTASLVLGVAAAGGSRGAVITAGVAGLVAGALSMAAGEYVSVASQRDAEEADLERERRELETNPQEELDELTLIYEHRGLSPGLARQVAIELSERDLLGAHARDELGFDELTRANPLQAAWTSAASFAVGASLPVIAVAIGGGTLRMVITVLVALLGLAVLGVVGARLGRAPVGTAVLRVVGWGVLAMVLTSGIGYLVGAVGV
jgi:VIT1/CCC1 family predicted Fe2+/Mn2+ transporter